MCLWVVAVDKYAKVYKVIEPKVIKRDEAETDLKQSMISLKRRQNELVEIEAKLQQLKDTIGEKQNELRDIQERFDLTNIRLNRAGRITSSLEDEEFRWKTSLTDLENELNAIYGNMLIVSGYITYLGSFPFKYRSDIVKTWIDKCKSVNIICNDDFSLINCLGDHFEMQNWIINGLPNDTVSLENAIIVTHANRWPIIYDPQEQANNWIRNLEKDKDLAISKINNPKLMNVMEKSMRNGNVLLLEDVGDNLEAFLMSISSQSFYSQGDKTYLRIGIRDYEYNENFKLYITTKIKNLDLSPEISSQTILVNFEISLLGLEEILLM